MNDIAGIPYVEAEFDKKGQRVGPAPVLPAGTNEVFVFSHGWNNNHDEARELYRKFFTNYTAASGPIPPGRMRCIVGILWPSKALDDAIKDAVAEASSGGRGPAASAGGGNQAAADKAIQARLDKVQELLGPESAPMIAELKTLVSGIEDSQTNQGKFVDRLRAQLTSQTADNDDEPSTHKFLKASGPALLKELSNQTPPAKAGAPRQASTATSTGGAAGLGNVFSGTKGAIIKFLNLFSYYEMKERAGTVGSTGVADLLDALGNSVERIHLIGHSFGCRVVTAAAKASNTNRLRSMALLQAAFSHNSFRPDKGFFRSVIEQTRIAGPVIITHTFNDSAVGIAYPAASLLAGQTASAVTAGLASAVGGPDNPFGALGSNGALHLSNSVAQFNDMLAEGMSYTFNAGKIYNLKADPFISDHGEVHNRTVAYAVASAHQATA